MMYLKARTGVADIVFGLYCQQQRSSQLTCLRVLGLKTLKATWLVSPRCLRLISS